MSGLPAGLSFNATTRTIAGTPTTAGTTTAIYTVTDATGATGSVPFTITILLEEDSGGSPDLIVESPSVSNSSSSAGASFTLTATVRNQGMEAAT